MLRTVPLPRGAGEEPVAAFCAKSRRADWRVSCGFRRRSPARPDVVDRDGLAQSLPGNLADLLELHLVFDRDRDAAADQDLAVLGLVTEPRREIADRADRRVVHALGKADLAQGRVSLRDADPKAEVVALPLAEAQ